MMCPFLQSFWAEQKRIILYRITFSKFIGVTIGEKNFVKDMPFMTWSIIPEHRFYRIM